MLQDDGTLRRDEAGDWVLSSDSVAIAVPPSIAALLAARVDRLGTEERGALERGSVVGEVFYRQGVEALFPVAGRPLVEAALTGLTRKQLVAPDEEAVGNLAGHDPYRFVHNLIRESAYGGLLKRTRAELHEACAAWLEEAAGDRVLEYQELIGYHVEQAYRYRLEIAPGDAHVRELGMMGAGLLAAAGRRALAMADARASVNLLERAVAMTLEGQVERLALLPDLGQALTDCGEFDRAVGVLEPAIRDAAAAGRPDLEARARVVRLMIRFVTDPAAWGSAIEELEPVIRVLEETGDHLGLARAWALMGYVHGTACRFGAAEEAVGRALEHARLAGDRREEARNLSAYAQSAVYGPMPVPEAIERCEQLLKEAEGDRRAEALMLCSLARLHALGGNAERARELYRRSRDIYDDLGVRLPSALVSIDSGPVELLAGDPEAAERELRRDFEVLEEMGERAYLSTTSAWLALAVFAQGRVEEAERFSRISEEAAALRRRRDPGPVALRPGEGARPTGGVRGSRGAPAGGRGVHRGSRAAGHPRHGPPRSGTGPGQGRPGRRGRPPGPSRPVPVRGEGQRGVLRPRLEPPGGAGGLVGRGPDRDPARHRGAAARRAVDGERSSHGVQPVGHALEPRAAFGAGRIEALAVVGDLEGELAVARRQPDDRPAGLRVLAPRSAWPRARRSRSWPRRPVGTGRCRRPRRRSGVRTCGPER